MSITERLANLSPPTVAVVVVVLLGIWYLLRKRTSNVAKQTAETAQSLAVAMFLVYFIIRPFIVQAFFIPSESMVPTLKIHDHILVNKFIYRFREPQRGDVVVFKSPKTASPDEKDFIKRVIGIPGDVVKIKPGYVIIGDQSYSHSELKAQLAALSIGERSSALKLINGEVMLNGRVLTKEEVADAMGEPNAKVKVVPGQVYINGKPLKEPYINEDPEEPYPGGRSYVDPAWVVVDKDGDRAIKIPKGKLLVIGDNRNASNDARFWGLLDRERVLGKAMFIFWPPSRIKWVR